jgi:hypothetical protein
MLEFTQRVSLSSPMFEDGLLATDYRGISANNIISSPSNSSDFKDSSKKAAKDGRSLYDEALQVPAILIHQERVRIASNCFRR